MTQPVVERKLAAILSADVQGFSRLMDEDEEATLHTLNAYRAVVDSLIPQHRGRIVGTAGDSVLAEFASVVDAVRCAVEIQQQLKTRNADLSPQRRMAFRIGVNLGDVMVDGEQIYGDGVNVAARLQSLADAGGVFISGTVYDHVENKLALTYDYLGEQPVKNINKPVRVYRLGVGESSSHQVTSPTSSVQGSRFKVRRVWSRVRPAHRAIVAGLLLMAVAIVAVRYFSSPVPGAQHLTPRTQPPLSTQDSELGTPAALALPDKPSIVVLPFDNMSNDPEQEYFSDGITEDITSSLSKISSLFVIARNSAFTYKGKAVKVQDVSREMGVRYVLEGSVRKANDQVRITAQLIDATTGEQLWSERFDRPFKEIFALQDEIVQKIVTTLGLQLTLEKQGFQVREHTDNLEAYDSYLRGLAYQWRLTKEAVAQARQLYEKAVALDPQYAEAYAWLGWTYWLEWGLRWSADPQTLERALALAQQAVTLDDSLPAAHSLLSDVYMMKQQYDPAIAEGERAIALDSNNADSYAFEAQVLTRAGRPEDALRMMEQAKRLNPRYPFWYLFELGLAYRLTGQYVEAITMLQELVSRNPNFTAAYVQLANSYWGQWVSQQSSDAQALAAAQRAVALEDAYPPGHWILGAIYLWQKQYELARAELERAITLDHPNEAWGYTLLAEVLSRVGRSADALQVVEQALRRKPLLAVDEHLNNIGITYDLVGRPEEAIAPLQQFLTRYPNSIEVSPRLCRGTPSV